MTANCRVTYVRMDTGEAWEEEFHDPYIYRYGDQVVHWNGDKWHRGVAYAGKAILDRLRPISDLNRPLPK